MTRTEKLAGDFAARGDTCMRIRAEDITKKYGQQVVLDHFTADFCTESAPGRGRVEAGTGQAESGSGTPMSGC